jgi:hypothetical protein
LITNVQPPADTNVIRYTVVVTNLAGGIVSGTAELTVLADTDHDGLPDDWENDLAMEPQNDDDMDGVSNLDEYRAGTNPLSAQSVLKLEIVHQPDESAAMEFLAVSNRTYLIQSRATLDESWSPYYPLLPSPTNHTQRIPIMPDGPSRLYRIVTPWVP